MRINCDFFRANVMSHFDSLECYLSHGEAQIREAHHTMRAEILSNQAPAEINEDAREEFLCLRQQELDGCDRRHRLIFRQTLRFSMIMSTFTLVESNLSRVAREIARRKHLPLDMEDLQAKDLVRTFQKFWTKVAGLSWWTDPRWDSLKDLEELRNCIAHRRGELRANEKRIHQLIGRGTGVSVRAANDSLADPEDVGIIVVEEDFCRRAVQDMAGLFKSRRYLSDLAPSALTMW
jgi:hypothetical protein